MSPRSRDEVLVAAPKLFQAVVAAAIDFYTWRLAQKLEKPNSGIAKWIVSDIRIDEVHRSTLTVPPALRHDLEPMAMVLLRPFLLEFVGSGLDCYSSILLAMALAYADRHYDTQTSCISIPGPDRDAQVRSSQLNIGPC